MLCDRCLVCLSGLSVCLSVCGQTFGWIKTKLGSEVNGLLLLLLAFVVLGLVSLVLCQEVGWEERLQNDLFCYKCDVIP